MSKKTVKSRKFAATIAAALFALTGSAALIIVGDDLATIVLMLAGVAGLALLRARPILSDAAFSSRDRRGLSSADSETAKSRLSVVSKAA